MHQKHDKQDIIARGETLLREHGYHDTGVSAILEACQIPKGSFYNYFENKDAYYQEVVAYYGERMVRYIAGYTEDQSLPPLERLRRLYYSLIDYAEAENCSRGCLIYNLSFEVGATHRDLAELLNTYFDRWLSLVTLCIEEGQRRHEIVTTHAAVGLANVIHTAFNGAYGRAKVQHGTTSMRLIVDTLLDMMSV